VLIATATKVIRGEIVSLISQLRVLASRQERQYTTIKNAIASSFDRQFYLSSYPDVAEAGTCPLDHYVRYGWREGRDPSPTFSTLKYMSRYAQSASSASNPFYHFLNSENPHARIRLGVATRSLRGRFLSAVELNHSQVSGWVIDKRDFRGAPLVSLVIDGEEYARTFATGGRADLLRLGARGNTGGFSFSLPLMEAAAEVTVSVRCNGQDLSGSPFNMIAGAGVQLTYPRARPSAAQSAAGVAIVVPVYNAFDETAACIQAVLRHTSASDVRLILIDDASTDKRIKPLLAAHAAYENVYILLRDNNLGYTRTINEGIALAGRRDVVLLNSDTCVGPRWLQNLQTAAYSGERVGTVTPISDNAGAFSAPEANVVNDRPLRFSEMEYQRAVTQGAGAFWPEAPTGNGFCLYIKRALLDAVGSFDAAAFPRGYGEENDFCMRALRAGWLNIIDDRTLVYHRGSASFGAARTALQVAGRAAIDEMYPEFKPLVTEFQEAAGISTARWRVRRLHNAAPDIAAKSRGKPRILFVTSTTTGGTPQTNADLMRAISDGYEPWLLNCNARVVTLSRAQGEPEIVRSHMLGEPLTIAAHVSSEYEAIVSDWLLRHAIELVHIRHLGWHSLNLPRLARERDIPVVFSFHDYYAICPTVKLLDETGTFCGGNCTATVGDCQPDLWRGGSAPPLKHRWINQWRAMFATALTECDAFVTTSPRAKALFLQTFPDLVEKPFAVIPHGRDFPALIPPARAPKAGEPVHILVPGNISSAKGRDVIERLAQRDREGRFRFHILGAIHPPIDHPNVIFHGPYEREMFAERAGVCGASMGAVFSLWPETYCHTLSELWSIGLPVIGFDFGAVGERIAAHGAGWLALHDDIDALYQAMCAIANDAAGFEARLAEVSAWQEGEGHRNTCNEMASKYISLYDRVLEDRKAFALPMPPAKALVTIETVANRSNVLSAAPC